jgi:hypothetical protein
MHAQARRQYWLKYPETNKTSEWLDRFDHTRTRIHIETLSSTVPYMLLPCTVVGRIS